MAVELRCPDCRARLKLKSAPEPGSEVECPECYAVFSAPDGLADDGPPAPRAERPAGDDGGRPRKKRREKAPKAGRDPNTPRKRRAKKKETNKALLTMLIVGGVMFLALVIGMLVWFFSRKPAAFELMNYLPPDSTSVSGANIGHVRKYVEFYKKFESNVNDTGFKRASDAAAKAVGADTADFLDYEVEGSNTKGEQAIVIKSKAPFDAGLLSKLPGAKAGTADGRTYYTADAIPGVFGGGRVRVFSPSPRLVVFSPESVSQGTFNKMISGNAGDPDNAVPGRLGALAKRASRGTAWGIIVFDNNNRPKEPDKKGDGGGGGGSGEYQTQVAGSSKSAKAFGFKASLGSRHVKFEAILQFGDSEAAQSLVTKFRDSPLAKADDASLDPPRYWKQFEQSVVGNRKVGTELYSTLGAKSSGDLFILYAESETMTLMDAVSGMVSKLTGASSSGGGGMNRPPGGEGMPPPPGGPGAVRGPGGGVVIGGP